MNFARAAPRKGELSRFAAVEVVHMVKSNALLGLQARTLS